MASIKKQSTNLPQMDNRSVSLLLRMQTMIQGMSKAEQRVARYVLDHPGDVISLSVAGLAEKIGVSDATVVRTCKSLGMSSYQDFKVTLARDTASPLKIANTEITSGDSAETVIDKIFQKNIHTLEYTHRALNFEALTQAAQKIRQARKVVIIGLGNSNAIAMDLEHKMMRIGIWAHAYIDTHLQMLASVDCDVRDVVVAISHSGSTIDIVNCAKACRSNGAFVIALTNIGRSPLSKAANLTLMTASQETEQNIFSLASRIAQMTLIDCLYTLIANQSPDMPERLYSIGKALNTFKY